MQHLCTFHPKAWPGFHRVDPCILSNCDDVRKVGITLAAFSVRSGNAPIPKDFFANKLQLCNVT